MVTECPFQLVAVKCEYFAASNIPFGYYETIVATLDGKILNPFQINTSITIEANFELVSANKMAHENKLAITLFAPTSRKIVELHCRYVCALCDVHQMPKSHVTRTKLHTLFSS